MRLRWSEPQAHAQPIPARQSDSESAFESVQQFTQSAAGPDEPIQLYHLGQDVYKSLTSADRSIMCVFVRVLMRSYYD